MNPLQIIFEDENILVIDKPFGIVVNGVKSYKGFTLQDMIEEKINASGVSADSEFRQRSGIVHRIDKETSGIVLVAKNEPAFIHLKNQFLTRTIEKEYKAVVCGKVEFENIEINAPIGRNPNNFIKMAIVGDERQSLTLVRRDSEKIFGELTYTSVTVYPKTGRTHQIRVHLASIKHPVAGDPLYAGKSLYALSFEIFKRMMLHARKILFQSPTSNELVSFESPLPKEFRQGSGPGPILA